MKTLATSTDINACIKSTRTWFSTDTTSDSNQRFQRWSYSTRDNGDIENETPGQEDIREARRLQSLLESQFNNVRANVETSEEWTSLEISLYPRKIQARPPTNLNLYQALAKIKNQLMTRLERTGRWNKTNPPPHLPSTGFAAVIFTDPNAKESIEFTIQVHKQDEIAWTLFLFADDTKAPLKKLTPKALIEALDVLETVTDGFFQTRKPTFLIAREVNGKLTYRRYRLFQGFTWVDNATEATPLADWEMNSFIKNAPNDPTLRFLQVTKGRTVKIEPYTLAKPNNCTPL